MNRLLVVGPQGIQPIQALVQSYMQAVFSVLGFFCLSDKFFPQLRNVRSILFTERFFFLPFARHFHSILFVHVRLYKLAQSRCCRLRKYFLWGSPTVNSPLEQQARSYNFLKQARRLNPLKSRNFSSRLLVKNDNYWRMLNRRRFLALTTLAPSASLPFLSACTSDTKQSDVVIIGAGHSRSCRCSLRSPARR